MHHSHHLQGEALRRLAKSIDWEFSRFLLAWAAINFSTAPFFAYYPLMMNSTYGIAPATVALLYALAAAVGIGLFVTAGRVAELFGPRLLFLLGLAVRAIGFGILAAVTMSAASVAPAAAMLGFILVMLAWPILSVSGTGLAASLTPVGEGAAMGLLATSNAIATLLGTAVAGPLVEAFGYRVVPPIAISGFLAAAALTAKVRRENGSRRTDDNPETQHAECSSMKGVSA